MAADDQDLDSAFAGGYSNYYNPAVGLMAIQQPEMFAQRMAMKGAMPPADFPDDFDHQDAHRVLAQATGSNLAGTKDQSRVGAPPNAPEQQGSFEERFIGAPGSYLNPSTRSWADPMTGQNYPGAPLPGEGKGGSPDMPVPTPPPAPATPPAPEGAVPTPRARPGSAPPPPAPAPEPPAPEPPKSIISRFGSWLENPRGEPPSSGPRSPGASAKPLSTKTEPTPATDAPSTAGGSDVPASATKETPGDLSTKDPDAKTTSTAEKKKDKGDSWDSFGKALAGVSAMKPPPVQFAHPNNPPTGHNQISRSGLPTELIKELSQIGHPGATQILRLGASLRGR